MSDPLAVAVGNAINSEQTADTNETSNEVLNTDNAQEALETLESKDTSDMSKKEKIEHRNQIEKFKLKVDGQESDFEIDLSDKEELVKHFQKSKASDKRMKESSDVRKAAERFITMLRTNPRKVLSDPNIGVDVKKLAQEIIDEEISNAAKTPEELEISRLTKELEEIRAKRKEDDENNEKSEFERLQQEQELKLESGITSALDTGGLPKSPYTVKRMAEIMLTALQHDIDLEPKDVIPLLKKQMQQDLKDMFGPSSDDLFEEMFKENIGRVRKRIASKAKQSVETASNVKSTGEKPKEEKKEEKKMSMKDFLGI